MTLYSIGAAALAWVASLPILGREITFPYGLALGLVVAIVNLNVIARSVEKAIACGKKGPVTGGFIVRIALYGGAFALAARTAPASGVGAAIGFLLPRIVAYVRYGLVPRLRRAFGKEPEVVYVTDTASRVFAKEPRFARYHRGREYLTYRHYRKMKRNERTK